MRRQQPTQRRQADLQYLPGREKETGWSWERSTVAMFNPPFGMDIGFELGVVFAGAAYYFLRRAELAQTRR